MFEKVHMPKTKDNLHHIHFLPHRDACEYLIARQVKRPSSLPTVRNQTDIIMWRTRERLEALAFDTGIISQNNAIVRDATTATPCGQNSATFQTD